MKLIFLLVLSIFATINGKAEGAEFLPYVTMIEAKIGELEKRFTGTRLNRNQVLTSAHELSGIEEIPGPSGPEYLAHVTFCISTEERYKVIKIHPHDKMMIDHRLVDIQVLTILVPSAGEDITHVFLQDPPWDCIAREAFYDSYEIVENKPEPRTISVEISPAAICLDVYNVNIPFHQFCGKVSIDKLLIQHDMGAGLFQNGLMVGVLIASTVGTQEEKTVLIGVFAKVDLYDSYITKAKGNELASLRRTRKQSSKKNSKGKNLASSSDAK